MSADVQEEKEGSSSVARWVALGCLLLAVVLAGLLLLGGGDPYKVTARFQTASQLVPGNLVQISGRKVGEVDTIELAEDGLAEVTLTIDDQLAPLRRGVTANVRLPSLSSSAGRYIDLHMPEGKPPAIEDGGVIPETQTTAQVDVDQFFNLFDERTRKGLRGFIRGNAELYAGKSAEAQLGYRYLNPSLVAADRLFREINLDERELSRFLLQQSSLVSDIAERRDDLARLIDQLADFTGALAREDQNLATTVREVPPFLRRANTTFVNLRATLDDLDPLVEESKPVAPRLRRVLAELRPFAQDARPTVRDLSRLVKSPGEADDLIDLGKAIPPFRDVAINQMNINGKERPGSFASGAASLKRQTPIWNFQRPYAVDLTGWFDDFSHTGIYDANGSASRVAPVVNAFTSVNGLLSFVPPNLRDQVFQRVTTRGQNNRCPGSIERDPGDGSMIPLKPSPDFNCDANQRAVGP